MFKFFKRLFEKKSLVPFNALLQCKDKEVEFKTVVIKPRKIEATTDKWFQTLELHGKNCKMSCTCPDFEFRSVETLKKLHALSDDYVIKPYEFKSDFRQDQKLACKHLISLAKKINYRRN